MFHDQYVLTNGMYLPFWFFYVLPRVPYGYIQCGFIPSAVWRLSNYYFQLLRCRNLALNRLFLLFLGDRYVSHLVVSICPLYVWTPPVHLDMPPYVWMPQMPHIFQHPPFVPMLPCASVCSIGFLHVMGDAGGPSYVWTPPMCLDASPCLQHFPHITCSPKCLYVLGIIACTMGKYPICWGGWVTSAHLSGF